MSAPEEPRPVDLLDLRMQAANLRDEHRVRPAQHAAAARLEAAADEIDRLRKAVTALREAWGDFDRHVDGYDVLFVEALDRALRAAGADPVDPVGG